MTLYSGDPEQLPPVVSTLDGLQPPGKDTIARPLFSRLAEGYLEPVLLRSQYRCHPSISALASSLFYAGQLQDGISVDDRKSVFPEVPTLCWVESGGADQRDGLSSYNDAEARAIAKLCRSMVDAGLPAECVGIISLYVSQAKRIGFLLAEGSAAGVKSSTVDAFQGEERDVIILSTVKGYANLHVSNRERINVALTRAKRNLIVFGCKSALSANGLWRPISDACVHLEHCNILCSSVSGAQCELTVEDDASKAISHPQSSSEPFTDDDSN